MRYFVTIRGEPFEVELRPSGDGATLARCGGRGDAGPERRLELRPVAGLHRFAVGIDGVCHDVIFEEETRGVRVTVDGVPHDVAVEDERERAAHLAAEAAPKGPVSVRSSMPGIVRAVLVKPGDPVAPGQPLAILEAMKMENEIRAEHAAVVREVKVSAGTPVEGGAELLLLDPSEPPPG